MTIRHLQIFECVCRYMSVTRAAQAMNMSQPAVSLAIRELESYYQEKLFVRGNRRIYLTEAGETLAQYAGALLNQFEEVDALMRDRNSFRECRFGVNISTGETRLADLMDAIYRDIPEAKLRVYVDNSRAIEEKLKRNEIEFAVLDSLSGQGNYAVKLLYSDSMAVVCRKVFDAPEEVSLNTLSAFPLMLREAGSGNRMSTDAVFEKGGCKADPVIESASDLCLLELARSGYGITVLPRKLIQKDLMNGTLREITVQDADFSRHYYLVYPRKKYQTGMTRRIVSLLENTISD